MRRDTSLLGRAYANKSVALWEDQAMTEIEPLALAEKIEKRHKKGMNSTTSIQRLHAGEVAFIVQMLRSTAPQALAATPAGDDELREAAFKLSCHAQFDLATKIAENVGYVLVGEPSFDDAANEAERRRIATAAPAVVILTREKSDRLLSECGYEPAARGRAWTLTREDMDRLHGQAHGGAMLGDDNAYQACLAIEGILARIAERSQPDSPAARAVSSGGNVAWQTVPLPATPEMLSAAERTDAAMRAQGFANAEPEAIYYAMLDAAPAVGGEALRESLIEITDAASYVLNLGATAYPGWAIMREAIARANLVLGAQPASPLRVEDARHEVANWMIGEGYVTGHGDTLDDLMQELVTQAQQAVLSVSASRTDKHAAVTEDELTEIMDETWPDGHRAVARKIVERLSAKGTSE
jgi:hypothetical protein